MPIEPITPGIAAGAWLWDKYGKQLTDRAGGALKSHWDRFKWKDAAERYRAKIKKLYGTMQIMGMAQPVPLDDIFTDAFMLDKPTAFGRFDIERLKEMSADPDNLQAERINGLRLVREKGNLFILGKPGAGKTTFLKYVALQAAEQNIDKIPIFVALKHWADSGLELMTFITRRFDICDFPAAETFVPELLKAGSAIVLFDGLDEVNEESGQRDSQTRAMHDFFEKYDKTQCLITCRIAASDYSFEPFTYVEVADFNENQIQRFVANWFRNNEGEKDEETCGKLLEEFARSENKGLRELARTPLLLTLLCLAFNETLTFPQRRVEIYQEAVDALLKKWDSSRRIKRDEFYRKLSLGHKENLLARIAAETFEKNEYFIPQMELERLITEYVQNVPPHDPKEGAEGEAILKAIEAQHGVFVERAREVYSFSHLTFQEYFTAKYIAANAGKTTLTELIKAHCVDKRWREVFLLTTSLLPHASQFATIFRRTIDELLRADEKLISLLAWAQDKSSLSSVTPWLVRSGYLFLELQYQSRSSNLSQALFDGPTFVDTRSGVMEIAHSLVRSLALARSDFRGDDSVGYLSSYLNRVIDRTRILGFYELSKELAELSLPKDRANTKEWLRFADELRSLMIKHIDVGVWWNLTDAQEQSLANYLNATSLLHDCLELAFMPPKEKEELLNSLYLPPS